MQELRLVSYRPLATTTARGTFAKHKGVGVSSPYQSHEAVWTEKSAARGLSRCTTKHQGRKAETLP